MAAATAGDRRAVFEAFQSINPNWTDAQFSVDLAGLSNGEAVIGQPLQIEFEAAVGGYAAYVYVSSHGDITLVRGSANGPSTMGSDSYSMKPPLGTEQLVVLFSNMPLESLFPNATTTVELGSDRDHALNFVHQLDQMKASGVRLATRKYRYTVAAPAGGTEYTTRSIIFQVEGARHGSKPGAAAAATVPSRIEFEFDSDRLTDRGRRDLDEFGEALVTRLSGASLVLEGHTDSLGTDDYNVSLSQRRAEVARRYLVESFGLDPANISAKGRGKANPVASNDSEADRSRNRRVDFVFSNAGPSH
jgi:outer membrane protein OmpA-like peptidoglycan-associated protein